MYLLRVMLFLFLFFSFWCVRIGEMVFFRYESCLHLKTDNLNVLVLCRCGVFNGCTRVHIGMYKLKLILPHYLSFLMHFFVVVI